jgi:hypothetical protein
MILQFIYQYFVTVKMSDDEALNYDESYVLPALYTIDKAGRERVWKIWSEADTVFRVQGLVDGKKQTYSRVFKGKSIGKKNETTADEQARLWAETQWIAQTVKGYLPKCKPGKKMLANVQRNNVGGIMVNGRSAISGSQPKTITKRDSFVVDDVETIIRPMKAQTYDLDDDGHALPRVLKYMDYDSGVYAQCKLDGYRCVARIQSGKIVLTTNNLKQFPFFGRLRDEIYTFLDGRNYLDGLDGELYTHNLVDHDGDEVPFGACFSMIQSMCSLARRQPHQLEDQIELVVFDLVDLTGKYDQTRRFKKLKRLFADKRGTSRIKLCKTTVVYSEQAAFDFHDRVAQDGYEGIVLRDTRLTYSDKRSLYIRKYKSFIDREYTIINATKDDGVDDSTFVWVLVDPDTIDPDTNEPITFRAKPIGSEGEKRKWYKNYTDYIGKRATIKFQNYSEKNIPRFPVCIAVDRQDQ